MRIMTQEYKHNLVADSVMAFDFIESGECLHSEDFARAYEILTNDLAEVEEHGELVGRIAVMLARELEMDAGFCNELEIAASVHDIGKLRLSGVLYKKRNEAFGIEEMKQIRMHPKLGYDILKQQGVCSEFVQDAVLYHHENFDGTGYPMNLKGNKIPFAARILRISDVFAALISVRNYRRAYDVDTALRIMIEEVKNYDMHILLALFSVVHSEEFEKMMKDTAEVIKVKAV